MQVELTENTFTSTYDGQKQVKQEAYMYIKGRQHPERFLMRIPKDAAPLAVGFYDAVLSDDSVFIMNGKPMVSWYKAMQKQKAKGLAAAD